MSLRRRSKVNPASRIPGVSDGEKVETSKNIEVRD